MDAKNAPQGVTIRREFTATAPNSVALFDQGLLEVLEASLTGLDPADPYVLGLADHADGSGKLDALSKHLTKPGGAAIVSAIGPNRQIAQGGGDPLRRYLVIAAANAKSPEAPVQIQAR